MAECNAGEGWIRWNQENHEQHGFGLWALEHAKTGTFLADCGLTHQMVTGESLLEVGYHLHASHRGQGFATEAGRACIEYAFHIVFKYRLHRDHTTFQNDRGRVMRLFFTDHT